MGNLPSPPRHGHHCRRLWCCAAHTQGSEGQDTAQAILDAATPIPCRPMTILCPTHLHLDAQPIADALIASRFCQNRNVLKSSAGNYHRLLVKRATDGYAAAVSGPKVCGTSSAVISSNGSGDANLDQYPATITRIARAAFARHGRGNESSAAPPQPRPCPPPPMRRNLLLGSLKLSLGRVTSSPAGHPNRFSKKPTSP